MRSPGSRAWWSYGLINFSSGASNCPRGSLLKTAPGGQTTLPPKSTPGPHGGDLRGHQRRCPSAQELQLGAWRASWTSEDSSTSRVGRKSTDNLENSLAEQKGNCLFRRAPNRQVGVLCDCSRAEGHFPKTFDLKRISSFSTSLKTSHPAKTGAAQIRWEAVSVARTRSGPPRTRLC